MSNVELIGKLCAGTGSFNSVRGGGFCDALSKAELAGCLSGLSSPEMDMALAKYGCDEASRSRLLIHVRAWTCVTAMREVWKPRSRDVLAALSELAVFESVDNCALCHRCNGVGRLLGLGLCKSCNGIGYKQLSGRARSGRCGMDEKSWRNLWAARYECVFNYVNGLDAGVLIRLRQAR